MHGYAVLLWVLDCTILTNCRFSGSPNVQNPQPTTSLLVFFSVQMFISLCCFWGWVSEIAADVRPGGCLVARRPHSFWNLELNYRLLIFHWFFCLAEQAAFACRMLMQRGLLSLVAMAQKTLFVSCNLLVGRYYCITPSPSGAAAGPKPLGWCVDGGCHPSHLQRSKMSLRDG